MTTQIKSVGTMFIATGLLVLFHVSCWAGEFNAFGPEMLTRTTEKPVNVQYNFTVLDPDEQFILRIDNGREIERVSSATLWLNGVQVVSPNQFKKTVSEIVQPVTLNFENQLVVQLNGQPGSGLTITVAGMDKEPPMITASVNPSANEAGWHNVDVTVSFECSDSQSGIADCTAPILVDLEAADQVVTGTARDNAGNTASVSVTLNVDKTPPVLSDFMPEDGETLPDPEVNLVGKVRETLAGLSMVTCDANNTSDEAFVNEEVAIGDPVLACSLPLIPGPNLITVQADDIAGNTTSSFLTIYNELPPSITIDSPKDSEVVTSSPTTVTGMVDDENAKVTVNGIPATIGNGIYTASIPVTNGVYTITALAENEAGSGSASVQVLSILGLSPTVSIRTPSSGFVLGQDQAKGEYPVTVEGWVRDNNVIPVGQPEVVVRFNGSETNTTITKGTSGLCKLPLRCWTFSSTQIFLPPDGVNLTIEVEATAGDQTAVQQLSGIVDFCYEFNKTWGVGGTGLGCEASLFQDGCRQSRRCIQNSSDGCSGPIPENFKQNPTNGKLGLISTEFGRIEEKDTPEGAYTVFGQRRQIQLPCNRHDECYHQWCPQEQTPSGSVDKKSECNLRFYNDMKSVCRRAYPETVCPSDRIGILNCPQWRAEKSLCYSSALIYYGGVSADTRNFSDVDHYKNLWPYGGLWTPCEGCYIIEEE